MTRCIVVAAGVIVERNDKLPCLANLGIASSNGAIRSCWHAMSVPRGSACLSYGDLVIAYNGVSVNLTDSSSRTRCVGTCWQRLSALSS